MSAPILLNVEDLDGRLTRDDDGYVFLIYDADGFPVVEIRAAMFHPDRNAAIAGASRFSARWSRYLTQLTATPTTRRKREMIMRNDGQFRKASASQASNCVEVAWRKSSASGPYNDACVEVRRDGELIQVRDSKNQAGPVLSFTGAEWDAFITGAKAGEFDRG